MDINALAEAYARGLAPLARKINGQPAFMEQQVDEHDLIPHDDRVTFRATKNGKFIITLDGGYNGTGFAWLAFQTVILMLKDCGIPQEAMGHYVAEVLTRDD